MDILLIGRLFLKAGQLYTLFITLPDVPKTLDFTVVMPEQEFTESLKKTFTALENEGADKF